MAKIINFKSKEQKLAEWFKESFNFCKEQGCKTLLIAGKTADGEFVTGYFRMDLCEKQEAVGHLQADIMSGYMDDFLQKNIGKYIEFVEE